MEQIRTWHRYEPLFYVAIVLIIAGSLFVIFGIIISVTLFNSVDVWKASPETAIRVSSFMTGLGLELLVPPIAFLGRITLNKRAWTIYLLAAFSAFFFIGFAGPVFATTSYQSHIAEVFSSLAVETLGTFVVFALLDNLEDYLTREAGND